MSSQPPLCVQVKIELGHKASVRKKPTVEGFTHDWTVFVRGQEPSRNIQHFVEKIVFHLHDSFPKPKRVLKEPPFVVSESGYGGFTLPIDIYFKNKQEPKKIPFQYDLFLRLEEPPVNHVRCEKLTFQNPTEEFKAKLLKAGGVIVRPGEEPVNQPGTFTDLFGPPIKTEAIKKPKPLKEASPKSEETNNHKQNSSVTCEENTYHGSSGPPSVGSNSSIGSFSKDHKSSSKEKHYSKESKKRHSTGSPSEHENIFKKAKRSSSISSLPEVNKERSSEKVETNKHRSPQILSSSKSHKDSERKDRDKDKERDKSRSKDKDKLEAKSEKKSEKRDKSEKTEHKSDKKEKNDSKHEKHEKSENKSEKREKKDKHERNEKHEKKERKDEKAEKKHKHEKTDSKKDKHDAKKEIHDKEVKRKHDKHESNKDKLEKHEKEKSEKNEKSGKTKYERDVTKSEKNKEKNEKAEREKSEKAEKAEKAEKDKNDKNEKLEKKEKHERTEKVSVAKKESKKHHSEENHSIVSDTTKSQKRKPDDKIEREKKRIKTEERTSTKDSRRVAVKRPMICDSSSSSDLSSDSDDDSIVITPKSNMTHSPAPSAAPVGSSALSTLMAELDDSDDDTVVPPLIPPLRNSPIKSPISPPKTFIKESHKGSPLSNSFNSPSKLSHSSARVPDNKKFKLAGEEFADKETTEINDNSVAEEELTKGRAPNGEELLELLDLREKLSMMTDRLILQKVVDMIAETGMYEIGDASFQFDLCVLDGKTVHQLQKFLSASS
ncbi:hypothetical protein ScPMuIL_018060 [Solemya velum]